MKLMLVRKNHARGTLTNGYEWYFLLVTVNDQGGMYNITQHLYIVAPYDSGEDDNKVIPERAVDMVAGMLASWVCCHLL